MIRSKSKVPKIIVIGDKGVGKSNIVTRFTQNEFSLESSSNPMINIYTDVKIKPSRFPEIRRSVIRGKEDDLKFHIWDTESQDALRSTDLYFKG